MIAARVFISFVFLLSIGLFLPNAAHAEAKKAVHGLQFGKFGRHGITAMQRTRFLKD